MASVSHRGRSAPSKRSFSAARDGTGVDAALAALAAQASGVFATRSDLCAWLACAVRQQARGGAGCPAASCGDVSAAACAVRFGGRCPQSSTPRQFARTVVGLATPQLEALLSLKRSAGF